MKTTTILAAVICASLTSCETPGEQQSAMAPVMQIAAIGAIAKANGMNPETALQAFVAQQQAQQPVIIQNVTQAPATDEKQ